jgi:hypothetical protein
MATVTRIYQGRLLSAASGPLSHPLRVRRA